MKNEFLYARAMVNNSYQGQSKNLNKDVEYIDIPMQIVNQTDSKNSLKSLNNH